MVTAPVVIVPAAIDRHHAAVAIGATIAADAQRQEVEFAGIADGHAAAAAAAGDRLGIDAVGEVARGGDAAGVGDGHVAARAARTCGAAERNASVDAGRVRRGVRRATIAAAAADGLGKNAIRIGARRFHETVVVTVT